MPLIIRTFSLLPLLLLVWPEDLPRGALRLVVTRSLALWCIGLDLVVGGACVVAAVAG